MTDITELAQREKFEAWWERTQHNGNPPRFGWSHWRDGEGYKVVDDDSELDGMWDAWKAAGAELVEALESEKRICATWRKTAEANSETLEKAQQRIGKLEKKLTDHKRMNQEMAKAMLTPNDSDAAGMEIAALRQRIAELESRTVKLPPKIERNDADDWFMYNGGRIGGGAAEWYNKALDDVGAELTAAGIKVEAG